MERRDLFSLLAMTPGAMAQSGAGGWSDAFAKTWRDIFKEHWKDTKEYTLAVLDAMPAEGFDTKPHPIQRTFGDQMRHLASANIAYFRALGVMPVPGDLPAAKEVPELDKAAVRKFVVASFDYVGAVLDKMSEKDLLRKDINMWKGAPPHSGTDVCLRAYMHTAHHRGQAVVYLRVKGIAPPTWKFEPRGS